MSIEIKNLSFYYNKDLSSEVKALDNISLNINDGEFVGIIGETGSGKSTLIEHLNGLNLPTEGDILVDGINTKDKKTINEIRKKIGFIFQYPDYQLFSETVLDDIIFGLINNDVEKEEAIKKAYEVSKLINFDLEKYKDYSPFNLSGGEKRKVSIAGVLIMEPSVLVLDEATSMLDPKSHRDFLELINKIHLEKKTTVILVSHNLEDIARYSKRVIVLDKGRLVSDDTPTTLFNNEELLKEHNLDMPKSKKFALKLSSKLSKDDIKNILIEEDLIKILREKIRK